MSRTLPAFDKAPFHLKIGVIYEFSHDLYSFLVDERLPLFSEFRIWVFSGILDIICESGCFQGSWE